MKKLVVNLFGALAIVALATVSVQAASDTWSGSVNSTWDTSTLNWNGGATAFTSGNDALFTGTPANNVTAATGLTIGAITLDNTFTGLVALTGANTVGGATTISGGTLSLANNAGAVGTSAIAVNSSGELDVSAITTADITYANSVAGAGKIRFRYNVTGGHDIFLNNLGSFTGTIELFLASSTGGKARLYNATLSGTSSLIIDSGTQLYMGGGNVTLAGIQVQGIGNTETRGAIRFQTGTLTSPISLMGDTTFGTEGATLPSGSPISAGTSGLKTLTLGGASDLSGGSLTINGIISDGSGQVALSQKNTGTLTLSGANTYSGGTTIGAGTTSVSGSSPFGSGAVTMTGGTLSAAAVATVTNNFTVSGSPTFSAASGNLALGGGISGTCGNVTFNGANTVTLGGSNNFATTAANFNGPNFNGTLVITNSTTFTGAGFTDFRGYLTESGNASVTILSGGSLTIITSSGSGLNSFIGQNAAGTSILTANGGSFSINGNSGFGLGNNINTAIGVLTITNGGIATVTAGSTTLQDVRNFIAMGRDNATGIINLAPGTLASGRQFVRDGSSGGTVGGGVATFNFNGGTLQSLANQTAGNGWFETATSGNFQVVTTTVMDGGATIDPNGFNVNINTVLAHGGVSSTDGGLTLTNSTGTGTLTLGGVSTYTGPTTVKGGILKVTGTVPTAMTVNPGGAIGASSGTFGALVTLAAGNAAINQQDGSATTTTFANGLTLNDGNVLTFDLGSSSDQISVGGTFTHNGTTTINLAVISGFSATTYTLITGASITATNGFVLGNVPAGYTGTLVSDGANLQVTLTQNAPSVAFWKGDVDNKWNSVTGGNNSNWATDSSGATDTVVPPSTPTSVTFAATGAANFSTVLGANTVINDLTLSTANNVTIAGPTNSLTLVAGLVNASTALNNLISVSNLVLSASQTFENDSANPLTVSSLISGSSALTIAGAGTVVLTSTNNSYNGGTTVSAGTLQLGDGTASNGAVSGTVTDNSVLVFANPAAQTCSGAIAGAGVLGKTGAGVLTLPNANTYIGGTVVSNGTLQVNNNNAFGTTAEFATSGTVANNGTINLNIGGGSGSIGWLFYPIAGNGTFNVIETTNQESRFDGDMSGFTGTITVPASSGSSKVDIEGGAINWNGAGTIIVSNGGTLFVESASQTLGAWAGQAEQVAATIYVSGNGNNEGYGALRVDDAAVLTGNVILQGNTVYGGAYTSPHGISGISGVISDGGLGYGISCANTISGQAEELWGANTYSGATTWTNSVYTLVLGNGSALQNSTLNIGPGHLQFDSVVSSNAFLFGGLTGSANIVLTNSSSQAIALTVGNNNSSTTFSGNLSDSGTGASLTKIGNGTLVLGGVSSYSGLTTVAGGKLVMNTLQTNATTGIAVNDGAALALDVSGTNQLAPAAYLMGSNIGPVTNEFVGLASTTIAPVNAGSLTLSGQTIVNIIGGSFTVGQTYPLIGFTSISGSGGFAVGTLPRGLSGIIITNGGNVIALNVTAYTPSFDVWSGAVNTNWNIATTTNWLIGGSPNTYLEGDNTRFDDTAIATNVFVTTAVSPNSMVVSNSTKTYTFAGSGIAGVGGLTKQGTGLLVLNLTNTYSGNTVISNGTIQLGGVNGIPGGGGKGDVTLNGTLDINAHSQILNGLSGNGTVDTVAGGTPTLTIGSSGSSSEFDGILQNSAGTLTVTKNGSGTLTLGGNNSYSGATTVSGGTLKLASANALGSTAGATTVATNSTLDLNGQTIAENITLNSGAALFNTSISAAAISGNITAANGSFTVIGGTGNITFATITSGGAGFDVTNLNTGTIDLAGTADNGYMGLHVAAGTVILDKTGAVGQRATSSLFVEGGLAQLGGTTGDQIFDGNTVAIDSGTLDMNGRNETVGILTGPGGVILNSAASTTGTLTIGGNNTTGSDYYGDITDGAGKVGLTKTGTGTSQTLQGMNTYSGPTVVANGTLTLVGESGISNSVLVNVLGTLNIWRNDGTLSLTSGQTLTGTGTVGGNVNAQSGSIINPGGVGVVGTLTLTGNTAFGGKLFMELNRTNTPSNCDQLTINGTPTYGGTLSVTNIGQTLQVGDTFQLFSAGVSGFTVNLATNDATGYKYTWTDDLASLGSITVATVTSPVNPTPTNLVAVVNGSNLELSWPADHTGWKLQVQTNTLAVGLYTNWVDVAGSTTVNAVTNVINPASGAVFYRMVLP